AGALDELRLAGVTRLLVLPLFPQYAGSTTGSTFDALGRALSRWRWVPELRFVNGYHDHPAYVEAVARSIEHHRARHGSGEILLLSFHGLPKRYLLSGDPYFCQCQATARLIAERLRLGKDDWRIVFQSRFGREEWLQPYTDETLKQLAADGVRRVDIVCPGFSADCVETLEEIAIEAAATFKEAGGESLSYVPALNADPDHINLVTSLIRDQIDDWRQSARADRAELERRQQRAMALGASR
ncbi:MAG: ferrochelatase, partial [Gammaproteobacteria bacterium]|nr:ferrochelatase [Gammaproteobacteria bacterium]